MPIYNLECFCCGHKFRKLAPKPPEDLHCPKCSESPVSWSGKGPTQRVVEVRDNGLMPKKVEQLADIDEMVRDRSTKKSDGEII
jgi:hypothetical protein